MKSKETVKGPVFSRPYSIEFKDEEIQEFKSEIDSLTNFLMKKPVEWQELKERIQKKRIKDGVLQRNSATDMKKIYSIMAKDEFTKTDYKLLGVSLWALINKPEWNARNSAIRPKLRVALGGTFTVFERMNKETSSFNCYDASLVVTAILKSYGIHAEVHTYKDLDAGHVFVLVKSEDKNRVIDVTKGWARAGFYFSEEEFRNELSEKQKEEKKGRFTPLFKSCHKKSDSDSQPQ